MCIWDSKCIGDIIWFSDTKSFQDIYRKKDDKWLLDRKCTWDRICLLHSIVLQDEKGVLDRKYAWYEIWLWASKSFQDIYRKRDGKTLLVIICIWDGTSIWDIKRFL